MYHFFWVVLIHLQSILPDKLNNMMSNIKKEILNTLKLLLGNVAEQSDTPKIYGSNEINISELAVGGKVELINADSTLTTAPDGSYETEDGSKFTVKDGLIDSIEGEDESGDNSTSGTTKEPVKAAATGTTETPEAEVAEDSATADAIKALEDKISAISTSIGELQTVINDLKSAQEMSANKEEVNEFAKQFSELNTTIKSLANIPAEFTKTNTNNVVADSKEEKMLELVNIFNSTRK